MKTYTATLPVIRGHSFDGCNWSTSPAIAWDAIPGAEGGLEFAGCDVMAYFHITIQEKDIPEKDTEGKHISAGEGIRFLEPGWYGSSESLEEVQLTPRDHVRGGYICRQKDLAGKQDKILEALRKIGRICEPSSAIL